MITEVELPGIVEPDGLRLRQRELPPLAPGQALVRMEATGISFAEQQMRRGKYYDQPSFPFVPGYDVVGVIEALGDTASGFTVGQRVAAVTKTGGWAEKLVLNTADLAAVPEGVGAEETEAVIVNGVTARRMLAIAKVGRGDTVVVLGANGGVGSLLVQLARHAGAQVIGVVSKHHFPFVRELGAIPVDRVEDTLAAVKALAPNGVKAVFDHVGGPGIQQSWAMLKKRGGSLVSYGTAATKDQQGNARLPVLALIGRLLLWNLLPNGRSATFFNLWAGRRRLAKHQAELRIDLEAVFAQLAAGDVTARIARAFPLSDIAEALKYAESGTAAGKVVLVP